MSLESEKSAHEQVHAAAIELYRELCFGVTDEAPSEKNKKLVWDAVEDELFNWYKDENKETSLLHKQNPNADPVHRVAALRYILINFNEVFHGVMTEKLPEITPISDLIKDQAKKTVKELDWGPMPPPREKMAEWEFSSKKPDSKTISETKKSRNADHHKQQRVKPTEISESDVDQLFGDIN